MPYKNIEDAKTRAKKYYLANKKIALKRSKIRMSKIRKDPKKHNLFKKYRREYYEKNKERELLAHKKTRKKHKLKWSCEKYNITKETYNCILKKQNYKCAICKQNKKLSIDHNHYSKKVRGLLCHQCNILLGMAKEKIATLTQAILYLENA